MSDERTDNRRPAPKGSPPEPPAPDERDATIERLERALAEERQNSSTLRETVDGLHFKAEVLEKGYSKQLADTRLRSENAERELAELKTQLATLGTGGEETLRLLTETRAELQRMTAERDQLHKQLGLSQRPQSKAFAKLASEAPEDGGTINALMANSDWVRERQAAADGHRHAQVRAEQDTPPAEMISPDLVFTKKDTEDDGDDER
jgi:hypothetical protein